MILPPGVISLIRLALEEDLGRGDLSAFSVPVTARARARIVAKSDLVISGTKLISRILEEARVDVDWLEVDRKDGCRVSTGAEIANLRGDARSLLGVERTILNFLQRTCGVATQAAAFRERIGERKVRIVDTRKTLPGWRFLDKMAVRDGGLWNHRFGLDSGVLVKENHIRAAGGITKAVTQLRNSIPHGTEIEVEVQTVVEAEEAIEAGVSLIMLDNFAISALPAAIAHLRSRSSSLVLEVSGNVSMANLSDYIDLDVDIISIGALTHSARAVDLSMLFDFQA